MLHTYIPKKQYNKVEPQKINVVWRIVNGKIGFQDNNYMLTSNVSLLISK